MKRLASASLLLVLLTGCVTKPVVNYYYGNYSQTLYRSRKDDTPESIARHRLSLEDVIQTSEKKGLRVPPGIYCEYAYLLARNGESQADQYFSMEVKTYPESEKFVSFIRAQMKQASSK
jgi:hypothetical protein